MTILCRWLPFHCSVVYLYEVLSRFTMRHFSNYVSKCEPALIEFIHKLEWPATLELSLYTSKNTCLSTVYWLWLNFRTSEFHHASYTSPAFMLKHLVVLPVVFPPGFVGTTATLQLGVDGQSFSSPITKKIAHGGSGTESGGHPKNWDLGPSNLQSGWNQKNLSWKIGVTRTACIELCIKLSQENRNVALNIQSAFPT